MVHSNIYIYIYYIYIWPWVINTNFPQLFRKQSVFCEILDADLDAQRDFAPRCIIKKRNSSICEVSHFGLIAFTYFVASNAVCLRLFGVCTYFRNNKIDADCDYMPKSGRISF